MKNFLNFLIKKHNNLVEYKFLESEKGSVINLTELLISKENLEKINYNQ